MRTKTLLLAAAISAAGIAAIQAQSNVYSLNVVGYYNVVLPATGPVSTPARWALVCQQLRPTGIVNPTLANSVTNISRGDGVLAHVWNQTTGGFSGGVALGDINPGEWGDGSGPETTVIPYGAGFFLRNTHPSQPVTITFVGEVPQGALVNSWTAPATTSPQYLNPRGSQVPQAGLITTDLKFTPADGTGLYTWGQPAGSSWGSLNIMGDIDPGQWGNGEPTLKVGEAVMMRGNVTTTWNRNFTVQ